MIDNRVDALRSWRGMRYIRLVPFASLFLLVLFVRGVYLKSFAGSDYFLIMISSFLPCFYPTCVLFLPADSVCRYKNSDRKGAVFAALALLQSLFGVFLRFIFYLFFSYFSSLALSLFDSGKDNFMLVHFVFMVLNLFFEDILFNFSRQIVLRKSIKFARALLMMNDQLALEIKRFERCAGCVGLAPIPVNFIF